MKNPVDLHIHSCYSDGNRTPAELVSMAAMQNFRAIAIADHDSTCGVDEAITSGNRCGVEVIPAVELSVETRSFKDVHLLGYYIEHKEQEFLEHLDFFRQKRDSRGMELIDRINHKLAEEGKAAISSQEVLSLSKGALGRPHIAMALIAKGYSAHMEDAFDNYLIPCNVPKQFFPMETAIEEIHRIGGLAVLAHPTSITRDRTKLRETIGWMKSIGLDGIETYNTMANQDETEFLLSMARRNALVITGGSDFHGNEGENRLGISDYRFPIDYQIVLGMKERLSKR